MIDLDAARARHDKANTSPYSVRDLAASQADVPALAAELRAAREVIEEADSYRAFLPLTVVEKLDDYHQAAAS